MSAILKQVKRKYVWKAHFSVPPAAPEQGQGLLPAGSAERRHGCLSLIATRRHRRGYSCCCSASLIICSLLRRLRARLLNFASHTEY